MHAVRMQIRTDRNGFIIVDTLRLPVTQAIRVSGLRNKTLQMDFGGESPIGSILVQGSITSIGNESRGWFTLFEVATEGLYPIVIPDVSTTTYVEPQLNAIRLRATIVGQQPPEPGIFPARMIAVLGGIWDGDEVWSARNTPFGD